MAGAEPLSLDARPGKPKYNAATRVAAEYQRLRAAFAQEYPVSVNQEDECRIHHLYSPIAAFGRN